MNALHATTVDRATLQLVAAFERCTLPALSHADHVRLAWFYALHADLGTVLSQLSCKLSRYAVSKGQPQHFHATVTFAFTCLVHERVTCAPRQDWRAFAAANADLFDSALLADYYPQAVLDSERARRVCLFPAARQNGCER